MESIQAIFFDAVGTLFRVRGSVGGIYRETAGRYGVIVSPEVLDEGFRSAFNKMDRLDYCRTSREAWDDAEKGWWRSLVHEVFSETSSVPDPFDVYFEEVYRAFEDPRQWELYPDTLKTLQALKEQGYLIGIISNFDRRIFPICEGLGLSPWLDSIHLPRDVGAAKPDGRIFHAALTRHGLQPHQAIHVGDHPTEDRDGARASGLIPFLLDRGTSQDEGEAVITELSHLLHSGRLNAGDAGS
jgi:putative hydrolase of the HAD superfamily